MSVTNGIPDLRKIESAIQERGILKLIQKIIIKIQLFNIIFN
jgi:hypothetical protein